MPFFFFFFCERHNTYDYILPADEDDSFSTNEDDLTPTDKSIWTHKFLQDWDNGWDVNFLGEPIDPKTACGGQPCRRFPLKPPADRVPYQKMLCILPNGKEIFCKDRYRYFSDDEDDAEYTL